MVSVSSRTHLNTRSCSPRSTHGAHAVDDRVFYEERKAFEEEKKAWRRHVASSSNSNDRSSSPSHASVVLILLVLLYVVGNVLVPQHQVTKQYSSRTLSASAWSVVPTEVATADGVAQASLPINDTIAAPMTPAPTEAPKPTKPSWMEQQVKLQNYFQDLIYKMQHPVGGCKKRRILLTKNQRKPYDGFCKEVQIHGRHLQVAMATDRTFVFHNAYHSAYAPEPACVWHNHTGDGGVINMSSSVNNDWDCLFEPVSSCTEDNIGYNSSSADDDDVPGKVTASMGINKKVDSTQYFDTKFYGAKRVVRQTNMFLQARSYTDILDYWDRTMGRYWVRAQMTHYLWKPSVGLKSEMQVRIPNFVSSSSNAKKEEYIGIHIRLTDNIGTFRKNFGREAHITRSVERTMAMADEIRKKTNITTIYLATDSDQVLDKMKKHQNSSWTIHIQANVPRHKAKAKKQNQWMWFAESRSSSAAAIAADVEVLRRADYLIGSYHSNVYRLATELNTAYHVDTYPLYMNRHHGVDIPWFEDP